MKAKGSVSPQKPEEATLYTIGYEGRTPAGLVRALETHGVRRLIDIRLQPISRVKGFSLMPLFEKLRRAGITYEHIKELGNPPEIRGLFHAGHLEEARRQYRAFLENGNRAAVDVLVGLVQIEPTAILCRERRAADCHRSVVADLVVERSDNDLLVEHL